jgi:hypothetical protein
LYVTIVLEADYRILIDCALQKSFLFRENGVGADVVSHMVCKRNVVGRWDEIRSKEESRVSRGDLDPLLSWGMPIDPMDDNARIDLDISVVQDEIRPL